MTRLLNGVQRYVFGTEKTKLGKKIPNHRLFGNNAFLVLPLGSSKLFSKHQYYIGIGKGHHTMPA